MKNKMTREEVIKGLSVCSAASGSCDGCPFYGEVAACDTELLKDALQLLEQDRELEIDTVVDKYRIYNKDDLMDGFFKFMHDEVQWYVDKNEDASYAEICMHHITGAVALLGRIFYIKEKDDANERL